MQGWRQTPVYERTRLVPGDWLAGPAVIEEAECSTVAGPSASVRVHGDGTRFLDLAPGSAGSAPALAVVTEAAY